MKFDFGYLICIVFVDLVKFLLYNRNILINN